MADKKTIVLGDVIESIKRFFSYLRSQFMLIALCAAVGLILPLIYRALQQAKADLPEQLPEDVFGPPAAARQLALIYGVGNRNCAFGCVHHGCGTYCYLAW